MKIWVIIKDGLRIGEESVLLLPAYLITSILSLMGVVYIETVIRVRTVCTMEPNTVFIVGVLIRITEDPINEVRNMFALILEVLNSLFVITIIVE